MKPIITCRNLFTLWGANWPRAKRLSTDRMHKLGTATDILCVDIMTIISLIHVAWCRSDWLGAEVSARHFGTSHGMSGQFRDPIRYCCRNVLRPKCSGSKVLTLDTTGRLEFRIPAAGTVYDSQPFRSRENSLPGTFAPWPFRSLAFSLPGAKWPRNFHSLELSYSRVFAPRNIRTLELSFPVSACHYLWDSLIF